MRGCPRRPQPNWKIGPVVFDVFARLDQIAHALPLERWMLVGGLMAHAHATWLALRMRVPLMMPIWLRRALPATIQPIPLIFPSSGVGVAGLAANLLLSHGFGGHCLQVQVLSRTQRESGSD